MAIDPIQLVLDDLGSVVAAEDPTITEVVPRKVAAAIALQGYDTVVMTDKQAAYIAALATKDVIPRLINTFMRKLQEAKGGPAEAKYVDLVEALKLLNKVVDDRIKTAAKEADPEDLLLEPIRRPPLTGPRGI